MLVSGQNMTAGYESTQVPMSSVAAAAQVTAINMHFPKEELSGYSGDFARAYKQTPKDEVESLILAQFEPETEQLACGLPLTLFFGGLLAPLLFTRFPLFLIHIVGSALVRCQSALRGRPSQHRKVIDNAGLPLRLHAVLKKTPLPTYGFTMIGIEIDLSPLFLVHALTRKTSARVEALATTKCSRQRSGIGSKTGVKVAVLVRGTFRRSRSTITRLRAFFLRCVRRSSDQQAFQETRRSSCSGPCTRWQRVRSSCTLVNARTIPRHTEMTRFVSGNLSWSMRLFHFR